MKALSVFLLGAVTSVAATMSFSHAFPMLETAVPAPDTTHHVSPRHLCVEFSGVIEQSLSDVVLYGGDRKVLMTQQEWVSSKKLCAVLPVLEPMVYMALWSVVSRDGHRTEGSYRFTVE